MRGIANHGRRAGFSAGPAARATLLALIAWLMLATPPAAAAGEGEEVESGSRIVRLHGLSREAVTALVAAGHDVLAGRPGEWVDLLVAVEELAALERLGVPLEIRGTPSRDVPSYFTRYLPMVARLQGYAADYPEIVELVDIGDPWSKIYGHDPYPALDLWALKISDHPEQDEAEPVILYTGVHHAREPASLEICLAIIDSLLTGYGQDPQITAWVDDHETWVIPNVNPDGHAICSELGWDYWRKNARDNDGSGAPTPPAYNYYADGVDLNRNYAWEWGGLGTSHNEGDQTYCGPESFSEPETQALREFHLQELPIFTVDYHSSGEMVLWPFGYDNYTCAPDHFHLMAVAIELAARIPRWNGGTYTPMQSNELYAASGTSSDWEYGELNEFAYTIETCTDFYPGAMELQHAIAGNVDGALYLQERIDGPGLRGRIRVNGAPAVGTITVVGIDNPALNQPRRSHPTHGEYFRILPPGTYDLRYEVDGWEAQLFEDVLVAEDSYLTIDVDFGSSRIAPEEPAALACFEVFPSVTRSGRALALRLPPERDGLALEVYDAQGRQIADLSAEARRAPGSLTWQPRQASGVSLAPGVYYARLRSSRGEVVRRFVRVGR